MTEVQTSPPGAVDLRSVTPEARRPLGERVRSGLRRAGEGMLSFVNLGAAIALRRDSIRLASAEMQDRAEPYKGLIERQANAESRVSLELADDIQLDFQLDAQRKAKQPDEMREQQRTALAEGAVQERFEDILAEVVDANPDLDTETAEVVAQERASDMAQLIAMNSEQRAAYEQSLFGYLEQRSALEYSQSELETLREERDERLARMGRVAVQSALSVAEKVRNLPYVLSSQAIVTGAAIKDRIVGWHKDLSVEGKRNLHATVVGVAAAGIMSAVFMRLGVGHSGGSGVDYNLVAYQPTGPEVPDVIGAPAVPDVIGGGPEVPDVIGGDLAPEVPDVIGGPTAPEVPDVIGGGPAPAVPDVIGAPEPASSGGDLSGVRVSKELFEPGASDIETWPNKITVSRWNSHNFDGSLSGISQQMLKRAGVDHPSSRQIYDLVNSLRPQAQPNGHLLNGQELDLRPATELLKQMISK